MSDIKEKDVVYQPKAVLVTGAAGFIASNVCVRLVKLHPEILIVVLDKLPRQRVQANEP